MIEFPLCAQRSALAKLAQAENKPGFPSFEGIGRYRFPRMTGSDCVELRFMVLFAEVEDGTAVSRRRFRGQDSLQTQAPQAQAGVPEEAGNRKKNRLGCQGWRCVRRAE